VIRNIPNAVILDRDSRHTRKLASLLEDTGFRVSVYDSCPSGDVPAPDIAFVNLELAGADLHRVVSGSVFGKIRELVLMGSEDDISTVRDVMDSGVAYFFCKPYDKDFLPSWIADVYAERSRERSTGGPVEACTLDQFGRMRGSSPPMRQLYRTIRKVAPSDATILLVGESGTGKELAARTIHELSGVAAGPFVAVNCAAIPRDLFESELFGHERGSFSGAVRKHQGLFERARGGTLFFDELTGMPIDSQIKLLRVLESGDYRRVGGEVDLHSEVRIVAATNIEPKTAIEENVLRKDLYYRLARFPINLPPLRKRSSDIVGLAYHFLDKLNGKNGTCVGISEDALDRIRRHSWPGNVRELRSVIERAYILAEKHIELEHLPALDGERCRDLLGITVGETLEDAQRKLIFATLEAYGGNKSATVRALGISLKTLYNRLNHYAAMDAGQRKSA
jgi:DNA-binding NtrC family response regulator